MKRHTHGFTLIEVLIALLVLGIGLLGVAGLQASSLRVNHGAYLRSQATLLAADMVDRMRANTRGFENGDYNLGAATVDNGCTTIGGCGSGAMAGNDLAEWSNSLADALPSGEGVVCIDSTPHDGDDAATHQCDGAPGGNRIIKIWWYDKEQQDEDRFVTEVRPL